MVIDTIDTICDTVNATKDAVADSVAQTQLILENGSGSQSDASLLLPLAIVTAALAGCLYLAHLYKRRLQAGKSTIISTKPMAKPMVLRLECLPSDASGMSSSTTT